MASKSTKYYDKNPASKKKKQEYQAEYNRKPSEVKRRTELNKLNKKSQKAGKGKVGDFKDISHKKGGGTTLEAQSKNRARNRGKK